MNVFHIIGSAKSIHTAILVVEYIRTRCCSPHSGIYPEQIEFREVQNPTIGSWTHEIGVKTDNFSDIDIKQGFSLVDTCRAFVAGRGEIWT